MKLTKKEIIQTNEVKLDQSKAGMFLHCNDCLTKYLKDREKTNRVSKQSPRDAMSYEVSDYIFTYPKGEKANILVFWCKKCGKEIWDSRHLQSLY